MNVEPFTLSEATWNIGIPTTVVGILFRGPNAKQNFWRIEIGGCGTVATYPLNGLPEVDTPCPCGDPTHWIVKYEKED